MYLRELGGNEHKRTLADLVYYDNISECCLAKKCEG